MRGLGVLLPSVLTLWILWAAFVFVFDHVAVPINRGIRLGVISAMPLVPEKQRPLWYVDPQAVLGSRARGEPHLEGVEAGALLEARKSAFALWWSQRWYMQALGLFVAILLIYVAGLLVGGLLGRQAYHRVEALISRIPGFKQVYPHVKQVVEMMLGEKPLAFRRVVMVEFPRPGSWVIAFVTNSGMLSIEKGAGEACITVFVPTTPTPFTGFTIAVPRDRVIDVPISIDEAIRYVITGGVLIPPHELPAAAVTEPGPAETKAPAA
jgi:uncharacterized membrane protein